MFKPQYIAIPIFAILIAIEAFVLIRQNRSLFDRKDLWTNIGVGLISAVFGTVFALVTSVAYLYVSSVTPLAMPMEAVWPWVLLVILDDFLYYWFHRISHESRYFWNYHVVHHSSNHYNLSVAVRQSWFGGSSHWIFYIPVAFLGFPLWAFVLVHGLNLIYQFWIHTELIGKLGPLEWIFNTPSHHRVHHGVNKQYQDKNYAGIFIIWDRMFGTFEAEEEKVTYGITNRLDSYNPLWINVHAWSETYDAFWEHPGFVNKLRILFGSPNLILKPRTSDRKEPHGDFQTKVV